MTNKQIAGVLKETAALIELTGGNPFRSRAMANAGRIIDRLDEHVADLLGAGTLTDVRGIGSGLADQIGQIIETGTFGVREDLLSSVPPGVLDMLAVKGLGAKKVRALWKSMGIQTLDELETAADAGRIAEMEGFGAKSQASIAVNVAALRRYRTRRHYADARGRMDALRTEIEGMKGVRMVEPAGALRRKMETVSKIELAVLVASDDADGAIAALETLFGERTADPSGDILVRGTLEDGFPVEVRIPKASAFGKKLFLATGSEPFTDTWSSRFGSIADSEAEEDVFRTAGIPFIPPELREGSEAIDAALTDALPELIDDDDLKGTLHNHSTYSDGAHTMTEMAEAARRMGLSYFGICDHSQSLRIANGLSVDEVRRQQEEIGSLNETMAENSDRPFRIFSGIESDILNDGSLDYDDETLATFDFVVASVHVGFNMSETEATERVVCAVANPYTRILGHPTGRLLLRREGYPLNHEAVLDACAEHGVAVELNANPYRLDLDWRWIQHATERGVLVSINPDAHAVDQLAYTRWGICVARKGWLTAASCLNALTLEAFTEWIETGRPA